MESRLVVRIIYSLYFNHNLFTWFSSLPPIFSFESCFDREGKLDFLRSHWGNEDLQYVSYVCCIFVNISYKSVFDIFGHLFRKIRPNTQLINPTDTKALKKQWDSLFKHLIMCQPFTPDRVLFLNWWFVWSLLFCLS